MGSAKKRMNPRAVNYVNRNLAILLEKIKKNGIKLCFQG